METTEEKKVEEQPKTEEPKTFSAEYVKELRDEAAANRKKAKELEDKLNAAETKKLEDEKKFEELYNTEKSQREAKEAELNEALNYKTEKEELEQLIRDDLLAELPEEHKELAKDFPIKKLKDYVKLNSTSKHTDERKAGKLPFVDTTKEWDDYTTTELMEIEKHNPELLKKLKEKKLKR